MKKTKLNFEAIVAKMKKLKETEEGKLKGGVRAIDPLEIEDGDDTNFWCDENC